MQEFKIEKLWVLVTMHLVILFLKERVEMLMFQIQDEKLGNGPARYLYSKFFWRHLVLAAAACICH